MADSDTEDIVDPYSDVYNKKWEATPIRNFKSNRDYVYAMKEDLAEWFNDMYNLDLSAENFLEKLESGVVLCQHANNVHFAALEFRRKNSEITARNGLQVPEVEIRYKPLAPPGTFMARDNISNFIHWCRHSLGVKDVLLFETEDLVMRKNEKSFVLCLLELARRGAKFGMEAPTIIQMETEIEAEIAGDEPPIFTQKKTCDMMSLDEMVRDLVGRCTCPVQFPMVRISDGKYRIGDSKTLIFVRILRSHVMVRVGGGWDTLEHYLDKHDPCRCSGHKSMRHHDPFRRQSSPSPDVKSTSNHSSKLRSSQEFEQSNNKIHHRYHSTPDVNHQNGDISPRKSGSPKYRPQSPSPSQSSTSPMRRAGSSGRVNRRDDDHLRSSSDGHLLRQSLENSRKTASPRPSNNSLSKSLNFSGQSQRYTSMNGDADDYEKMHNSHSRKSTRPASPRTDSFYYDTPKRGGRSASPDPTHEYMTQDDVLASSRHSSGSGDRSSRRRAKSPGPEQRILSPDSSDSESSSKKSGGHYCHQSSYNWNCSTQLDHPSYDISGNNRMSLWEKNRRGEHRTLPETPTTPRSSGRSSPSPVGAYIRTGRSSPSPVSRSGRCSPSFYENNVEPERPKSRNGRASPSPFERERGTARSGRSSPAPSRSSSVPAKRDRVSMSQRPTTPVRPSTPTRSATPTRGGSSFINREKERKEKMRQERSNNLTVSSRSGRASPSPVERRTETSSRPPIGRSSPMPRSSSPAPRPASPRVSSTRPRSAKKQDEEVVLMISRTDSGGHQVLARDDDEVNNINNRRTRDRDVGGRPASPRVSSRRSKEEEEREIRRRRCRSVSPERARRNEELYRSQETRDKNDRNQKRYRSKTPEPRDFERRDSNDSSLYQGQRQRTKQRGHNTMSRFMSGSNIAHDAYDSDDEADDSSNSSDQKRSRVKFNESLNRSIRHSALRPCSPVPKIHKLTPKFNLPKRVDPFPETPTKIPKPVFHETGYKKGLSGSTSNLSKLRSRASANQRTRTASNSSLSSTSTVMSQNSNTYNRNSTENVNRPKDPPPPPPTQEIRDEMPDPLLDSTPESTDTRTITMTTTTNNDDIMNFSFSNSTFTRTNSQESSDVFVDDKPSPLTNGHGMDSGFEDSFHHGFYTHTHSPERKHPPINMAPPLVTGRSTIIRSSSTSSTSASTEVGPMRPVTPTFDKVNLEELGVYDSDSTDTEYF